jgi:hypothetical protein
VARQEHDLRPAARNELANRDPVVLHPGIDHVLRVDAAALMPEPAAAGDDVTHAVAVDVGHHRALGEPAGAKHQTRRPGSGIARIRRDLEHQQIGEPDPAQQFGAAVAVDVAEGLVVVIARATALHDPARPRAAELRSRVLPPVDLVADPILTEHQIEVAIAVDVVHCAASLRRHVVRLDQVAAPGRTFEPPQLHLAAGVATGDHEVIATVAVEVGDHARRLVAAAGRRREVAAVGRTRLPRNLRRQARAGDE